MDSYSIETGMISTAMVQAANSESKWSQTFIFSELACHSVTDGQTQLKLQLERMTQHLKIQPWNHQNESNISTSSGKTRQIMSSLKSVYFILLQLLLIRHYGLLQFRNIAEIMNLSTIW
jgi:hypothetical protein